MQLAFATPVVFWAGWPFFERGWRSLVTRNLNMFTLIALGIGVAWLYSVVATVWPSIFPPEFREHHGAVATYFESAAVITVLVLVGQVLELGAHEKTSGALKALLDLAPKTARKVLPGGDEEVPLDTVQKNDLLRVPSRRENPRRRHCHRRSLQRRRGRWSPARSMPVTKETGAKVIAGTLNAAGSFVMRAEKVGAETLLSQIVQMVAAAQRTRAPIQKLADRVSSWFVPLVIVIALIAFAAWAMFGPEPRYIYGLVAAVTVLIIACPCALGLATPMSIMVGVGRGAEAGVLIKNAEALERMEKIDTLVIDKTGTLTEGKPRVVKIVPAQGFAENDLLKLAASLESASEHPLADAIVNAARKKNIALARAGDFHSPTGKGVTGTVDSKNIALGNARFLKELGVDTSALANDADELRRDGATAIFIAIDGRLPASSPSPTRSSPPPPPRCRPCARTASASSCSPATTAPPRRRSRTGSASTKSKPKCCPIKKPKSSRNSAPRAASSPWPATASTTRRRLPPPMSASPWAPAPTSRSKARASRS